MRAVFLLPVAFLFLASPLFGQVVVQTDERSDVTTVSFLSATTGVTGLKPRVRELGVKVTQPPSDVTRPSRSVNTYELQSFPVSPSTTRDWV